MTLPQIVHNLFQVSLYLLAYDLIGTAVLLPGLWFISHLFFTRRKNSVPQDFCPEFTPEVVSAPPPVTSQPEQLPIRGQTAEVEAFLRDMSFFHEDIIGIERLVASLATLPPSSSAKEGNDNTPYYEN